MTIQQQIFQDLLTLVNTSRPEGVPEFKEFWSWAILPASLPFGAAYWSEANPVPMREGKPQHDRDSLEYWELDLIFVVWEKGDGIDTPQKKTDPILAWIGSKVLGKSKENLYRIVKAGPVKMMPAQADYPYARLLVGVRVKFQTSATNLEAWA
jgi:hypothetical protein